MFPEELSRTMSTSGEVSEAVLRQRRASLQPTNWTPEPRWSFNSPPEYQHQMPQQQQSNYSPNYGQLNSQQYMQQRRYSHY